MAQIYTFNSENISAARGLTPVDQSVYPLSANGVNIISLSAVCSGIAYNAVTSTTGSLISTTVEGNVFSIDTAYTGSQMALLNAGRQYTIFQFLSSSTVGVALSTNYTDVSTANRRRKRMLGYNS